MVGSIVLQLSKYVKTIVAELQKRAVIARQDDQGAGKP
jgi:hypothetical protein